MVVSRNEKLAVIFSYNNTGATSCTLILPRSISEKVWDLLYTDGCNGNDRRHGRLSYTSHCTTLCHNILHSGICRAAASTVLCSGNRFCLPDRCTAVVSSVFICCNVHTLKNCSGHQPKDHSQCHRSGCFLSKAVAS